jgi:hypothetical protein
MYYSRRSPCGQVLVLSTVDLKDHLSYSLHNCGTVSHLICLARASPNARATLLPVNLDCAACHGDVHWSDVIRGCYRRLERVQGGGSKKKETRTKKSVAGKTVEAVEAVCADEEDDDGDSVRGLGASESEDEQSTSENDNVTKLTGGLAKMGLAGSRSRPRTPTRTRVGSKKQVQRGIASVSALPLRGEAVSSTREVREELERDMENLRISRATKAQFIELSD